MTATTTTLLALCLGWALGGCQPTARWTAVMPTLDRTALAVWGPDAHELFVVGGGLGTAGVGALLQRGRDGVFADLPTGRSETLWWVWGTSATDVWVAGERGFVGHFDGTSLTPVPVPAEAASATLFGIWGASGDDVWVVGGVPDSSAIVLRGNARGLSLAAGAPTPAGVAWFKVWGSSASDVFVVGQAGTIAHYDGSAWATQPAPVMPAGASLFTVSGRSAREVYAVGGTEKGVALRYDGTSWSALADPVLGTAHGLNGVDVGPDGLLSMVGFNGTRLHGHPGALVADQPELTRTDLHATFVDDANVIWAVGGNFQAPAGAPRQGVIFRYGP